MYCEKMGEGKDDSVSGTLIVGYLYFRIEREVLAQLLFWPALASFKFCSKDHLPSAVVNHYLDNVVDVEKAHSVEKKRKEKQVLKD